MENSRSDLLRRVANQFALTKPTSDHLVLVRWEVLWLCQSLLGEPPDNLAKVYIEALDTFADEGASKQAEVKLSEAARRAREAQQELFPRISPEKREEVERRLSEVLCREGIVGKAESMLPSLKQYLGKVPADALLSGICYRFQLVAEMVRSVGISEEYRRRAAAAIVYLAEVCDAIDDSLGLIGLLDDDYALRSVLAKGGIGEREMLHWSEKVARIWEDLPFLKGVDLRIGDQPVAAGWLDRLNSYLCYSHALREDRALLLLLEPTVACSLLNPTITLIALLILDALTSSQNSANALERGCVYAIDEKFFMKYSGVDEGTGWLRMEGRDGAYLHPIFLAMRMTPAYGRRLSSVRELSLYLKEQGKDTIQRFFGWSDPIGTAAVPGRVVLVTSRARALALFDGVESNGIRLIRDGLVRIVGTNVEDAFRGLVLVVPSVSIVRKLMASGICVRTVIVDGYDRLREGQHDLSFLRMAANQPSIIAWSPLGYCPPSIPGWLQAHRRVEVSSEDLAEILELDQHLDEQTATSLTSLWEVVTGPEVRYQSVDLAAEEARLGEAIALYLQAVMQCERLPEHWRYHIKDRTRRLISLLTATAAEWSAIHLAGKRWLEACEEMWNRLTHSFSAEISHLRELESGIQDLLARAPQRGANSKGRALSLYLTENRDESWFVVCGGNEEASSTRLLMDEHGHKGVGIVTLRELEACKQCLVTGWLGSSFGRRLMAHSPREIRVFVTESEEGKWRRLPRLPARQSSALEMIKTEGRSYASAILSGSREQDTYVQNVEVIKGDSRAVVLWFADNVNCKVLRRDSHVVVEQDGRASVRQAWRIRPFDQVVLGSGASRWSPAEEFTQAVLKAVERTKPDLVLDSKEWRRALRAFQVEKGLSTEQMRVKLAGVGVYRELPTIEGWLDLDNPSPIGPQQLEDGLAAIWAIAGQHSNKPLQKIAEACKSLRSLHWAASQAIVKIWAGEQGADLGVDEGWLRELVLRVRETVEIHEVERVGKASVPPEMLGWWVPLDLAARLEIVESESEELVTNADAPYDV